MGYYSSSIFGHIWYLLFGIPRNLIVMAFHLASCFILAAMIVAPFSSVLPNFLHGPHPFQIDFNAISASLNMNGSAPMSPLYIAAELAAAWSLYLGYLWDRTHYNMSKLFPHFVLLFTSRGGAVFSFALYSLAAFVLFGLSPLGAYAGRMIAEYIFTNHPIVLTVLGALVGLIPFYLMALAGSRDGMPGKASNNIRGTGNYTIGFGEARRRTNRS